MTTPVTKQEIIESLEKVYSIANGFNTTQKGLAERIKQHGIAQDQEAVAWEVTCGDNRYYVDSLDDAQLIDDLTNHDATYKALSYTAPPTPQDVQSLICEIDEIPNLNNDSMWKAHVMFTLDKYRGMK